MARKVFPSNPELNDIFTSGRGKKFQWNGHAWKRTADNNVESMTLDSSSNEKLVLRGSTNPQITFNEGGTTKGNLHWSATDGEMTLVNEESSQEFTLGSNGGTFTGDIRLTGGNQSTLEFYDGSTYRGDLGQLSNDRVELRANLELHLSSNSDVKIKDKSWQTDRAIFRDNGAVELYYPGPVVTPGVPGTGVKRFETTGAGVTVTGTTFSNELNVSGVSTFHDNVDLGDNDKINLGDGNDLQIYHDGNDSLIDENGTGNLRIRATELRVEKTGTSANMLRAISDAQVELFYSNSKKLETATSGVNIVGTTTTGQLSVTGVSTFNSTVNIPSSLYLNGAGNSSDLYIGSTNQVKLDHNGSSAMWSNTTGYSYIRGASGLVVQKEGGGYDDIIRGIADGAVELYYDDVKKFETTGNGVTISGESDVNGDLNVSGVSTFTGAASFGSNVTVSGNLTVNGTTTTINSTTLSVDDKNIELGSTDSPSDTSADGGGITLKGSTDHTFNWVNSTDAWTSSEHMDIASGKSYKINGTNVLSASSLGSNVTGSSLTSVGTITSGTWQGTAIANAYLANSTISGKSLGTNLSTATFATSGTGLSGSATYNGSSAATFTVTSNATSANTASTIVARNSSGNFSAGTITASLSGTATNATNFNVAADNSTNATHYVIFTGGASGNQRPNSDTGLTYNPSSNTLTASTFSGALSGNASTATTLATARNFSASGDATASSVSFNGSGNVNLALTLANSGVTAATYGSSSAIPSITVDAKGRITSATTNAINIDSTSISNGTSNVSAASNSNVTVTTGGTLAATFDTSQNLTVAGTVTAQSSITLKDNVTTISDALSKVLNLRGVEFDYKANGRHSIGVVAEEVENVFDCLVVENNGVKSVAYQNLTAVLIEAVKELTSQVDKLKTELNTLKG